MKEQINDYLRYLNIERGLSASTRQSHGRNLERYLHFLQEQKIASQQDVDHSLVIRFLEELHEEKRATATVIRMISSLKRFHQFLRQKRITDHDPVQRIDTPKKAQKLPGTLTLTEAGELVETSDTTKTSGIRGCAVLEVIYATGTRISELIGLRLGDLHLSLGLVQTVRKGDKEQIIPLGDHAVQWLEHYLDEVRPLLVRDASEMHVFVNNHGKGPSWQGIWKNLKQLVREAGIYKEVTPYTLRYSFAAHLLENGTDLRTIQELSGHADISTTQIYIHIMRKRMMDVYKQHFPRAQLQEGEKMLTHYRKENRKIAMGLLSFYKKLTSKTFSLKEADTYESEDDYELFFFTSEGSVNIQRITGIYWATSDQLIIHDISLNPSYRGENMGLQMLDELREKYPDVPIRATEITEPCIGKQLAGKEKRE